METDHSLTYSTGSAGETRPRKRKVSLHAVLIFLVYLIPSQHCYPPVVAGREHLKLHHRRKDRHPETVGEPQFSRDEFYEMPGRRDIVLDEVVWISKYRRGSLSLARSWLQIAALAPPQCISRPISVGSFMPSALLFTSPPPMSSAEEIVARCRWH